MVGIERSILPLLAERDFHIAARAAALSFLIAFGLSKAAANYLGGRLSDRLGRKRVLVAGWLAALPVPLMLIWAPSWSWVLFAKVWLGASQGLAWSMTVVMKIDLDGPERRGLAMGLNEFAGYGAVALLAWTTAQVASSHGLRPYPFLIGVAIAFGGLAMSMFFIRETLPLARQEDTGQAAAQRPSKSSCAPPMRTRAFRPPLRRDSSTTSTTRWLGACFLSCLRQRARI